MGRRAWARAPSSNASLRSFQTALLLAYLVGRIPLSPSFLELTACTKKKKRQDTTRAPRPGETDGKEYHFVTQDKFKSLLSEDAFIEHAQFSTNYYGTSVQAIEAVQATGRRCILDIESQVGPWLYRLTSSDALIKASRASGRLRKRISIPSTSLLHRLRWRFFETVCAAGERIQRKLFNGASLSPFLKFPTREKTAHAITSSSTTISTTRMTNLERWHWENRQMATHYLR